MQLLSGVLCAGDGGGVARAGGERGVRGRGRRGVPGGGARRAAPAPRAAARARAAPAPPGAARHAAARRHAARPHPRRLLAARQSHRFRRHGAYTHYYLLTSYSNNCFAIGIT